MSEARTKLDILYQDVLGDVKEVIDKAEAISRDIDAKVISAGSELEKQTGVMLAAVEELRKVLVDMTRQVDEYATEATRKAVEDGKREIQHAAAGIVRASVGGEVTRAISDVHTASRELLDQARLSKEDLKRAASQVSWSAWQRSGVVMVSSLLSAGALFLGLKASGQLVSPTPALSQAEARTFANGQALERIWNQLTPKEQQRINQLAQQGKK